MNLIQRLKYFLYGVFLGLIIIIFFFGNRINSCSFFKKKNNFKENFNIKNK